jgi:hypothetical protein
MAAPNPFLPTAAAAAVASDKVGRYYFKSVMIKVFFSSRLVLSSTNHPSAVLFLITSFAIIEPHHPFPFFYTGRCACRL